MLFTENVCYLRLTKKLASFSLFLYILNWYAVKPLSFFLSLSLSLSKLKQLGHVLVCLSRRPLRAL